MKPTTDKPSLYRLAFLNQYNAILLGGAGLFALATYSWLPAVVGAGLEALWMTFVPDSGVFKRWATQRNARQAQEQLKQEAQALLSHLGRDYGERFLALEQVAEEIQSLSKENESLDARLVGDELQKIGQILHSFLRMATVHQRLTRFLDENPAREIQADMVENQRQLRTERDGRVQASLAQALSLAEKRLKQNERIAGAAKALGVQMDTLEKSLNYLKSHIVAIGTRQELADELDGLVQAVDSVEQVEVETRDVLDDLHRTAVASGQRVALKS
jgi:hypothetical protein